MGMYEDLTGLACQTPDWIIPLQPGTDWNLRTAPGAILSGVTRYGKSYHLLYLVMMASIKNAVLYLADPKHSDLSNLSMFMPPERVVWKPEDISAMVGNVVDIMMTRFDDMAHLRADRGLFQADYVDFGFPAVFLVIEEFAAFVSSLDKRSKESVDADIKRITLQGAQAGIFLISVMQSANTNNISSESRSQAGYRVFLGNSGGIEYDVLFGKGYTYPCRAFLPGQGVFTLAGVTDTPQVIETPRLDKAQLPDALKRALTPQYNKDPLPPATL